MGRELERDVVDALLERAFVRKQQAVSAAQLVNVLAGKTAPRQADDVEARQMRPVAERHPVGNQIVLQARHAAEEGVRADARELDDGRAAADDGEIADRAMARQHDVVGEDHVVADAAVVPDVGVGEEGAAIADGRHHATAFGAGIHGHAFADLAVGPDRQRRRLALVFQILRLMADRGKREDPRARPDRRRAGNDGMTDEFDTITQRDAAADTAEGADLDTCPELCSRLR